MPETPTNLSSVAIEFRNRLDIDDNGQIDHVYIVSEGTAHVGSLAVFDSAMRRIDFEKDSDEDWESANLRWAYDFRLIHYRKRYYLLGQYGQSLHYLTQLSHGVEKVVCEFAAMPLVAKRIAYAQEPKLCKLFLNNQLDHVPFDKLHALTQKDLPDDYYHPYGTAAKADIDNDNRPDYVVQAEYASGAGRGCDMHKLVLLDETRTNVAKSPLSQQLDEMGVSCKQNLLVLPFRFNQHTYLERQLSDNPEVLYIVHNRIDKICQLEQRLIHFPLSPYDVLMTRAKSQNLNVWKYLSIFSKFEKKAELLLQYGHSTDDEVNDEPLLFWVIRQHRIDVLKFLLKHGANPNQRYESDSVLHTAVTSGTDEMVRLLLKRTTVSKGEDLINTALVYAQYSKIPLLLQAGLKVEAKHLEYALREKNIDAKTLKLLQQAAHRAAKHSKSIN